MKLIVDAMGGDHDASIPLNASVQALLKNPVISKLTLVGDEAVLLNRLTSHVDFALIKQRIVVQHSEGVVAMHDKPSAVLKARADTSMLQALQILVNDEADACISAGNTGALVGLARHLSGLHASIKRLAICAQLPTLYRSTYLLDVGANVDCTAEQLYQFARMGCALVESHGAVEKSRVSALSIGAEAGKGNIAVKQAVALCQSNSQMNFTGMIEGDHLLQGDADVIFCDGFVGNVALKSCEGTARYIRALAHKIERPESASAEASQQVKRYQQFMQAINPDQFNGAYLLGLNHLVVKAHGNSNESGFAAAINKAVKAVEGNLRGKLALQL